MNIPAISDALYVMGKGAIAWAPVAISMVTDTPSLLTVGELGNAAFRLYNGPTSTQIAGRVSALTGAAVALASPFTFFPFLSLLSIPSAEAKEPPLNRESDTRNTQKMDPKYAKEEIASRVKKTPKQPKLNPAHAKEVLHHRTDAKSKPQTKICLPKSGQHHPNDVAFYDKIASSTSVTSVLPLNKFKEERCGGTLYLRSEDTNYMHAKDGYVRAEDTGAIGEIPPLVAEKLIKEGRVWYRNMEKAGDVCKHIDEVHKSGGKIKRLILVGHGNPHEMLLSQKAGDRDSIFKRFFSDSSFFQPGSQDFFQFGRKQFESKSDNLFGSRFSFLESGMDKYIIDSSTHFPLKGCLNNLEKNADIILISCSTGQQGSRNLADSIALQADGRRVLAPTFPLRMSNVRERTVNNKLELYFEDPKGKDATYIASSKKP